jgi:hypothetical protein
MKKLIVILVIVLNTINLFSAEKTLKFEGREAGDIYGSLISSISKIHNSVESLKERNPGAAHFLYETIREYLTPRYDTDYYNCISRIKTEIKNSKYSKDIDKYTTEDYIFAYFDLCWVFALGYAPDEIYITLENGRITKITATKYGRTPDFWINIEQRRMHQINRNAEYYKMIDKDWNELDITILEYLNSK